MAKLIWLHHQWFLLITVGKNKLECLSPAIFLWSHEVDYYKTIYYPDKNLQSPNGLAYFRSIIGEVFAKIS